VNAVPILFHILDLFGMQSNRGDRTSSSVTQARGSHIIPVSTRRWPPLQPSWCYGW